MASLTRWNDQTERVEVVLDIIYDWLTSGLSQSNHY
jgi:hypothetical protein